MKRLIYIFIILILVSLLPSCIEDATQNDTYSDPYLYTQIDNVLYRISTISASVTPVCPDPLCPHADEGCPFFGVENIRLQGQYLYYLREWNATGSFQKLCRFDLKEGRYELIYQPTEGGLQELFLTDSYAFFLLEDVDESWNTQYTLMRYDITRGQVKRLSDQVFDERVFVVAADGDRIYWSSMTDESYSTDVNYQNRIDNDRGYSPNLTAGEYSYRYESTGQTAGYEGYQIMTGKVTRIDRKSVEELVVFEQLGCYPIFYRDKIIYCKLDELRYMGELYDDYTQSYSPYYDRYGGKFYICDSDGKNERLLCDISDTSYAYMITSGILGGKMGVGDWIGLRVAMYTDIGQGTNQIIRDDNAYLLINIVTGEVKEAKIETYS